jgi:hypothetical protein
MLRFEFEQIRDLPGKRIEGDLMFAQKIGSRPCYVVGNVPVENAIGLDLVLDGIYTAPIKKLIFNFRVRGVGPICRVCVNGRFHDKVGRTHKHHLVGERDPAVNLPNAEGRPDLRKKTVLEIWNILCDQANIIHNGTVVIPGESVDAPL